MIVVFAIGPSCAAGSDARARDSVRGTFVNGPRRTCLRGGASSARAGPSARQALLGAFFAGAQLAGGSRVGCAWVGAPRILCDGGSPAFWFLGYAFQRQSRRPHRGFLLSRGLARLCGPSRAAVIPFYGFRRRALCLARTRDWILYYLVSRALLEFLKPDPALIPLLRRAKTTSRGVPHKFERARLKSCLKIGFRKVHVLVTRLTKKAANTHEKAPQRRPALDLQHRRAALRRRRAAAQAQI